jgi:hypothetical protein
VSRGGADQGGEEADGLRRLSLGERAELGLCQFDLLIHVISGRLSLVSPAFGPDLRSDFVDSVLCRTPRFLYVFTTGPLLAGTRCHDAVPMEFPPSPRRVPAESRRPAAGPSRFFLSSSGLCLLRADLRVLARRCP